MSVLIPETGTFLAEETRYIHIALSTLPVGNHHAQKVTAFLLYEHFYESLTDCAYLLLVHLGAA